MMAHDDGLRIDILGIIGCFEFSSQRRADRHTRSYRLVACVDTCVSIVWILLDHETCRCKYHTFLILCKKITQKATLECALDYDEYLFDEYLVVIN